MVTVRIQGCDLRQVKNISSVISCHASYPAQENHVDDQILNVVNWNRLFHLVHAISIKSRNSLNPRRIAPIDITGLSVTELSGCTRDPSHCDIQEESIDDIDHL